MNPRGGSLYRSIRLPLLLCLVLCGAGVLLAGEPNDEVSGQTNVFRIGFSSGMFTDVNENDAKAALKVWSKELAADQRMNVKMESTVLDSVSALSEALRAGRLDSFSASTPEYLAVEPLADVASVYLAVNDGQVADEHLLLVHQKSDFRSIQDLRGRSLTVFDNSRASLAMPWLDTILLQAGLEPAGRHFGRIIAARKLTSVILPVFFRQQDACLVTRRGLKIANELNPQIGKNVRLLARSPEVVPVVTVFLKTMPTPLRNDLMSIADSMTNRPSGRQILTIFKSDAIEPRPMSCLDSARELLALHQKLTSAAGNKKRLEETAGSGEAPNR